ncbi:MAG: hypothetical protein K0U37_08395 [Gammaproteobacteria bacterium]|nr:hypothetical protein [Gammaproteobacteria bacterium]
MEYKSEFTNVTTKITGNVRKNSLYHFISLNTALECLSNYRIMPSNNPTRNALYLYPNHTIEAQPAFRGIQPTQTHITIDEKFSLRTAEKAGGLGPAHLTVSYDDFRLHVYFDENGKTLDFHVKRDSDGTYETLTEDEKAQIAEQSNPTRQLIQTLIGKKHQAYTDLNNALFKAEEQLSHIKNKAEYVAKAHAYLTQLENFNRHSDTVIHQQGWHIQRRIERFETPTVPLITQPKETPEPEKKPEPKATASISDTSAESKTNALDELKSKLSTTINTLITQHEQNANLATLIPLLLDVNELLLDLTFSYTLKKDGQFLRQQKNRLPLTLETIADEFKSKLRCGDIDYIQENYPLLVGLINMHPIFFDFITELPKGHPDAEVYERQIQVADYFHECSELYRSVFLIRNILFFYSDELKIGYSFLIKFFFEENFPGFQMMLRQGIAPDSHHLMFNEYTLNSIQTILMLYPSNPDIRFIQTLLEYGVPLSQANNTFISGAGTFQELKRNHGRIKPQSALKALSTQMRMLGRNATQTLQQAAQQNHAFKTAVELYSSTYPEIFTALVAHTDALTLFKTCGDFVIHKLFSCRFMMDDAGESDIYFALLLNDEELSATSQAFFEITQIVVTACHTAFEALEPNQQKMLITQLGEAAEAEALTQNTCLSLSYFRAAQIAYTMMNDKTPEADTTAVRHFLRAGQVISTTHPEAGATEKMRAQVFLNHIKNKRRRQQTELEAPRVSIFANEDNDTKVDDALTENKASSGI